MKRTGVFVSHKELAVIHHAVETHCFDADKETGNVRTKGMLGDDEPQAVKDLISKIADKHGINGKVVIANGTGEIWTE